MSSIGAEPKAPLILNVASDAAVRLATSESLRRAGFEVREASLGAAALRKAAEGPDLVLLDADLPDISGLEVCRRLKSDPATHHLPVLHLSATTVEPADRVAVLEGGADGTLIKPVDPAELIATVRALLRLKEPERRQRKAQRALVENEDRYRDLVEHIHDLVGTHDLKGRILSINRAGRESLGLDEETLLKGNLRDLLAPEVRDRFQDYLGAIRRDGRAAGLMVVVTGSGERRVWEYDNTLRTDGAGEPIVRTLARDVTEKRRAEAALRESEARYRTLFEQDLTADYVSTPEGRILDCNPAFARLLGFESVEAALSADAASLYPVSGDRERFLSRLRHEKAMQIVETELIRRDGARIAVLENVVAVFDGDDRLVRLFGFMFDITDRKRAEQRLRENERRLSESQRLAHIGSWELDPRGGGIIWSEEMYRLYGVSPETFDHSTEAFLRLIHPDDRAAMGAWIEACSAGREPGSLEFRVLPPDGTTRILEGRGKLERDEEATPLRMVGTAQDVTERTAAEEEKERLRAQLAQAQKMESVGRLAGGIAHDFNNALTVILGHAALALEEVGREGPLQVHLDAIRKAAQSSADLTGQLLAFARRQPVAPAVLDLNRTVAGLLEMLRRLIGEEIDLAWAPGPGTTPVEVDPSQISQLLTNLCVNARDAIAGVGKVAIETSNVTLDEAACSSRPGSSPGDYVRLAVSDDGAGMGKDVLEHIFEPFFTTKALGRGTGLGLATVYGIVKQNRGFVFVTSEPGEGTAFEIYLRASSIDAVQPEVATADGTGEAPRGRGETVLLAEDEAPVLLVVEAMLEELGYTVLSAGTPGEAMRKAGSHPGSIDILVTDVVMPEMNGRDLAERMRAIRPRMRCLFVSGYTADVIARRGVLDGGIRFLQKPFSSRELAFKVREALDGGGGGPAGVDDGVLATAVTPWPAGFAAGKLVKGPPRPPESGQAKGRRILYVDDDPQLVELATRILRKLGHDVTGYSDPAMALGEFQRRPGDFDAVVTDLAMPGLPGLELTRRLLAVRADFPVVVTSGYVSEEDETAARVAGARAVLQKPGTIEELGGLLDRVLREFDGSGNREV